MPNSWDDDDVGRTLIFRPGFDKACRDSATNLPILDHTLVRNIEANRQSWKNYLRDELFNSEWKQRAISAFDHGLQEEAARTSESGDGGPDYSWLGTTPSTQSDVLGLLGSDKAVALARSGHHEECFGASYKYGHALGMQVGANGWAEQGGQSRATREGGRSR